MSEEEFNMIREQKRLKAEQEMEQLNKELAELQELVEAIENRKRVLTSQEY
jgi:hypothetical protein